MIAADPPRNPTLDRQADWELDFYSRPILEPDGKKRWELLISSTPELGGGESFRYARRCPAGEVNSTWLAAALREAIAQGLLASAHDCSDGGLAMPGRTEKLRPCA